MYRYSNKEQYRSTRIIAPVDWDCIVPCKNNFSEFISHGYKGYYYFTGSSYDAANQTKVQIAHDEHKLCFKTSMCEAHMSKMLEYYADSDKFELSDRDFVRINLITANNNSVFFAVNPAGHLLSNVAHALESKLLIEKNIHGKNCFKT